MRNASDPWSNPDIHIWPGSIKSCTPLMYVNDQSDSCFKRRMQNLVAIANRVKFET